MNSWLWLNEMSIINTSPDRSKDFRQKRSLDAKADYSIIRPGLFWDTDSNKIDWQRQRRAVIERIMERGNDQEKVEIMRFYGVLSLMK